MKQIIQFFAPFVLLMLLACCLGCYFQQFYKTNTTYKVGGPALKQLRAANKYFIVHTPDKVFSLKNVNVTSDILLGEIESLDPTYMKYLNPMVDNGNRFTGREEGMVLSQVHLYTNNSFDGDRPLILSADKISRMDVYCLDKTASGSIRILSSVGFSFGIVLIAGGSFLVAKRAGLSLL
jgi:hypothetical protein